jgi:hypothetical protein
MIPHDTPPGTKVICIRTLRPPRGGVGLLRIYGVYTVESVHGGRPWNPVLLHEFPTDPKTKLRPAFNRRVFMILSDPAAVSASDMRCAKPAS